MDIWDGRFQMEERDGDEICIYTVTTSLIHPLGKGKKQKEGGERDWRCSVQCSVRAKSAVRAVCACAVQWQPRAQAKSAPNA